MVAPFKETKAASWCQVDHMGPFYARQDTYSKYGFALFIRLGFIVCLVHQHEIHLTILWTKKPSLQKKRHGSEYMTMDQIPYQPETVDMTERWKSLWRHKWSNRTWFYMWIGKYCSHALGSLNVQPLYCAVPSINVTHGSRNHELEVVLLREFVLLVLEPLCIISLVV